jgi:hypothetical protein
MRKPEDNRCIDLFKSLLALKRARCAFSEPTLVRIDIAMTGTPFEVSRTFGLWPSVEVSSRPSRAIRGNLAYEIIVAVKNPDLHRRRSATSTHPVPATTQGIGQHRRWTLKNEREERGQARAHRRVCSPREAGVAGEAGIAGVAGFAAALRAPGRFRGRRKKSYSALRRSHLSRMRAGCRIQ